MEGEREAERGEKGDEEEMRMRGEGEGVEEGVGEGVGEMEVVDGDGAAE